MALPAITVAATAISAKTIIYAPIVGSAIIKGGQVACKVIAKLVFTGLKLQNSTAKVLGKGYKAFGEVVVKMKNADLLPKLNNATKGVGEWEKVFELGFKNGKKVEIHYFRNNVTKQVFDVKIKYQKWHQKEFKNL